MLKVILYIWQLPQHLLGLLLILIYNPSIRMRYDIKYYYTKKIRGAISLGDYIITCTENKNTLHHEKGHSIQSKKLGWFYLFIVGIPSILHAALCKCKNHSYYDFYTEKWADKLSGVVRKK